MHELAIVGAGPVGLSAALAASRQGIDCIVLEAQPRDAARDARVFALSYASRLILERIGAWPHIDAIHAIQTVHVSERGAFGATTLAAHELGLPALGYVTTQVALMRALRRCVTEQGIACLTGAEVVDVSEQGEHASVHYERDSSPGQIDAATVALAEGGAGLADRMGISERDYAQHALIATIKAEGAASGCAYERFTPAGPIALLPTEIGHALIWTVPTDEVAALLALDDDNFARALNDRYGSRIGRIGLLGPRSAFPLKLRFARNVSRNRIALIGNSAQTLHPIAGQGFNLGLRDAFELALALAYCSARGSDSLEAIHRYRAQRRVDRTGGRLFTDFLLRAFTIDNSLVAIARSAALAGLDACGPAKKWLTRRMIFGAPR